MMLSIPSPISSSKMDSASNSISAGLPHGLIWTTGLSKSSSRESNKLSTSWKGIISSSEAAGSNMNAAAVWVSLVVGKMLG